MSEPLHPLTRLTESFSDPDLGYWDNLNRERVDDTYEDWLIDGLLPIGASVLYADPGTGKSFLTLAMIHHLIYGRPLGPWGSQGPGQALVWVLDLEGTWRMTQDRGYALTPYGELPQDGRGDRDDCWCFWQGQVIPTAEAEDWATYSLLAARHLAFVDRTLTEAEAAGSPIRFVVVDTLAKFAGPRPHRAGNAYEWEAWLVDALNRIGMRHRAAILLIHHTNKSGEISGSTGIGGSAVVTMRLDVDEQTEEETTRGDPATAVLRSTKVRIGPPFTYSLRQNPEGPWDFVDQAPAATIARGHARTILFQLAEHPDGMTYRQLLDATGIGGSLRTTLYRMRRAQEVVQRYGRWWLPQTDVRSLPGQIDTTCSVCHGPMTRIGDADRHPGCTEVTSVQDQIIGGTRSGKTSLAAAVEQEARDAGHHVIVLGGTTPTQTPDISPTQINVSEPVAKPDTAPAAGEASSPAPARAMTVLKETILASRMHPVLFVKAEHRESPPWSLVDERATGEHRWLDPALATVLDDDQPVTVLDRNGSYPSAMSSVVVAANLLHHTGALQVRARVDGRPMAGLFQIVIPPWDVDEQGIGHPLGRTAERTDIAWVTTPHMALLEKLAEEGTIPPLEILDSWTGRGTGGLFTKFSAWVRDERRRLGSDPEALVKAKTDVSIAIRSLWPKSARSPFWRPDWSVAIRAEAAIRHWIRARDAVRMGAPLLKLGAIDEAVFATSEVPPPYQLGTGFGQVKHKSITTPDGEEWRSPMPASVWRQSVRALRKG